jgi:H+/gluconate symporter-like permease
MGLEAIYHRHLIPPQPWEYQLAEKTGFTMSMLRFAIAFFSSIPVAIIFRRIPSVRGKFLRKYRSN